MIAGFNLDSRQDSDLARKSPSPESSRKLKSEWSPCRVFFSQTLNFVLLCLFALSNLYQGDVRPKTSEYGKIFFNSPNFYAQ
jgi:hypothetical protein